MTSGRVHGSRVMAVDEYERIAAAETGHWWYRNARSLAADLLEPWLPHCGLVLDAGCGPGATGAWLTQYSTVVGVDVAHEALSLLQKRHADVVPVQADLTRLPFADESFGDVIVVTVLYAVPDDRAALRELRRVLRPGGVLLTIEPAFPALRRSHDRVVGGVRRYRRAGLVSVMGQAGFTVRRSTYACSFLAPPAGVLALAERVRPPKHVAGGGSDLQKPSLDTMFARLAAIERRWLSRGHDVPFGTSLAIVATRDDATRSSVSHT